VAEPALKKAMSLDEFLDWEAEQEPRYELVDGRPVMMTGGTVAHDFVRGELAGEIRAQLKGKPCRMAIDVKIRCETGNVRYPDVAIHCGPFRPKDRLASGPRVVVEVLSASTKATDFLVKLTDYQSVPDISTYLIFWQDEARVLVHRRLKQGWAAAEEIKGRGASVPLPDVGVVIVLESIYGELLDAT
jgi:Uma2 family endonuclease